MGGPTWDASETSSTVQTEASTAAPLQFGHYAVDFQVKKTSLFGGKEAQYCWRQFVVTSQTLEIYDQGKREHAFRVRGMTIEHISSHFYRLKAIPWHKLEFSSPSTSRLERFRHVLDLAAQTPHWTPPTFDAWTNFLHVAKEINETDAAAPCKVAASSVTAAQVQDHLNEMLAMYDFQGQCSTMEQVYSRLLDLEAEYYLDRSVANFAHTVHRLHPSYYAFYSGHDEMAHRTAIKELYAKCPYPRCGASIPVETMYKFHIKGDAVNCFTCSNVLTLGVFEMVKFIANAPVLSVECTLKGSPRTLTVITPDVPSDGSIDTFMADLRSRMKAEARKGSEAGARQLQQEAWKHTKTHFNGNRSPFGFDLVKAMIRQLDFVNKICPNYNYWSHAEVLQASIVRYHKFMHLMKIKNPTDVLVPTADIDLVWHTHQTDTQAYYDFCTQDGGYLVKHDDTIEGGDLKDGYSESFALWNAAYDEPYSSYAPMGGTESRCPSRDCRFFGVNEAFPVEDLSYTSAVIPDDMAVATEPPLDNLQVYMAVIGTPVMDGRVRLKYSRQSFLMAQGRLGYVYYAANESQGDHICGDSVYAGCGTSDFGGCGSGGCASHPAAHYWAMGTLNPPVEEEQMTAPAAAQPPAWTTAPTV
ncbi:unnamed protein product [Aphanomyces euteiches]